VDHVAVVLDVAVRTWPEVGVLPVTSIKPPVLLNRYLAATILFELVIVF
jgi:hypothetical protein